MTKPKIEGLKDSGEHDALKEVYSSDAPVVIQTQDLFNRYPFAKRVASVISKRTDPSSIVIGIYGAWGEGKTSIFNFIEGELNSEDHVVCIRFNPWRFGQEEEMLLNFFNDMAAAIDRSIETKKEKVGEFINKFVKPTANMFGKGEVAEGVSAFFSNADIEEIRSRVESILNEEKKRVVILLDDIDRLEKNEIHAVFRLVKLTADFKYTAYVLAFDKEMVASALQERFGEGNTKAGNAFLEKIIQVPLQLPSIDSQDLRTFCLKGVDNALSIAEINLTDEQVQLFVNNFTAIEKLLKTPRQAMLYSNILTFSLPILKGEVSPVDLMLIEGIRVFSPEVYDLIRTNKSVFISEPSFGFSRDEKEVQKRKEKIEIVLNKYSYDVSDEIKSVLLFLFPKLNNVFGNTHYGSDWEKSWNKNQRICSSQYFNRYFTYSIPKGDIPDQVIKDLLQLTNSLSSNEIAEKINEVSNQQNLKVLILKLRNAAKSLTKEQAEIFAIAVSKLGDRFPNPVQFFPADNPYKQGAMLTSDIIESLEIKKDQIELAKKIVQNAEPLHFATECFTWFRRDTEDHPNPKGFTNKENAQIGKILAGRISEQIKYENFLQEEEYIRKIPQIFYFWVEYGNEDESRNFLKNILEEQPEFVFSLLESFLPTSWDSDGILKKSDFERMQYDSIIRIIDPIYIICAIDKMYGEITLEKEYPRAIETFKEKLVRQFLWVHNYVVNEKKDLKI